MQTKHIYVRDDGAEILINVSGSQSNFTGNAILPDSNYDPLFVPVDSNYLNPAYKPTGPIRNYEGEAAALGLKAIKDCLRQFEFL